MRELINSRVADAKGDHAKDNDNNFVMSFEERRQVIVIDYAQNMDILHFGQEQARATYYFSPHSMYCFGVSNVARETRPQLFVHCYQEGEGKKGGDIVASLIMQALPDQGFNKLDDDGNPICSCQLMIAADTCSGQNKNNMVIRLVPWLVEKGFYKEMEQIFLLTVTQRMVVTTYSTSSKQASTTMISTPTIIQVSMTIFSLF